MAVYYWNKELTIIFHPPKIFTKFPKNTKYLIESSSVLYGVYRHMTDVLGLDATLSNPYKNIQQFKIFQYLHTKFCGT